MEFDFIFPHFDFYFPCFNTISVYIKKKQTNKNRKTWKKNMIFKNFSPICILFSLFLNSIILYKSQTNKARKAVEYTCILTSIFHIFSLLSHSIQLKKQNKKNDAKYAGFYFIFPILSFIFPVFAQCLVYIKKAEMKKI